MWADSAVDVLSGVAVPAKRLKPIRAPVLKQPLEKGCSVHLFAVFVSVVVDVVDAEEHGFRLPTAGALPAIMIENRFSKSLVTVGFLRNTIAAGCSPIAVLCAANDANARFSVCVPACAELSRFSVAAVLAL